MTLTVVSRQGAAPPSFNRSPPINTRIYIYIYNISQTDLSVRVLTVLCWLGLDCSSARVLAGRTPIFLFTMRGDTHPRKHTLIWQSQCSLGVLAQMYRSFCCQDSSGGLEPRAPRVSPRGPQDFPRASKITCLGVCAGVIRILCISTVLYLVL